MKSVKNNIAASIKANLGLSKTGAKVKTPLLAKLNAMQPCEAAVSCGLTVKTQAIAATMSEIENLWPLSDAQEEAFRVDSETNLRGVQANAAILIADMPELEGPLSELIAHHDESKYIPPEHYGYVWDVSIKRLSMYPSSNIVQVARRAAMRHHEQNNAHHLEFWEARTGVETMPIPVLAHWFADLAYGCLEGNKSLADTLQRTIQDHMFSTEQIMLTQRWLKLFPELNY